MNQSKSWAVGEGYPDRSDQAKNNSKFYVAQAKASTDAAQALSDRLAEIAGGDVATKEELASVVAGATSHHWDITKAAADWQEASDSFAGMTAHYKANKPCEGMSAGTDIADIVFLSGDGASVGTWSYLRPTAGAVEVFSASKPAGTFSLRLTEVK